MTVDLETLLIQETKAEIYATAIAIAESLGLPVSSWQAGDPTRSLYHVEAMLLEKLEALVVNVIKAGFTEYAEGDWLKLRAEQVYRLTVPPATAASTDVVLTNSGVGVFTYEPFDIQLRNSLTGKTYHNTTGGTLDALGTLTVTVEADEVGSDSSAGAGEIDEIISGDIGVTCANATAAIGTDEQTEATTRTLCAAKLDSVSPNGPKGVYTHVALTPELSSTTAVTRARSFDDSDTGDVTLYVAGPSGAVGAPDRTLVETAVLASATPLCITPSVFSAANVTVPLTYTIYVYRSANLTSAEVQTLVSDAIETLFAEYPIGGDIVPPATTGSLDTSLIQSTILGAVPKAFRVDLTLPAADVSLAVNEVPVLGTVTATVTLVNDP